MLNSLTAFNQAIAAARESGALYVFVQQNFKGPLNFEDLLRAQVVYAVSAFDKLMHDLIRIGIRMQYQGARPHTAKYLAEPLSMSTHNAMLSAVAPDTPEMVLERAIFQKHSYLSFQDPDKVVEGLSYIWDEKAKWDKIADKMGGLNGASVRTELKLLVSRRNAIVHEADMDPMSYQKKAISKQDADTWVNLIEKCGNAIGALVI